MSSEWERRLEGFLAELPEPEPEVGERALTAAVSALPPAPTARRGLRAGAVVFAGAVVLLAVAAGSLAAAGALHVSFGNKPKEPKLTQLVLPSGTNGIAAVVNGRLSVLTKSGFRLQGLPVSAAALSPHALFVAAGIGDSLVAMTPNGRRAWSQPAGGTVVQIAWAPFGNRIAYVVRSGHGFVLHVIWGNGTNDAVIDRSVRSVLPSWRADSLAFAYVGAGGHTIVYDVAHESRQAALVKPPASAVAFAAAGDSIAVQQPNGLWLLHQSAATRIPGRVEAFGWMGSKLVEVLPGLENAVVRSFAVSGEARGSYSVRGVVVAVTPTLLVVRRGNTLIAGDTPVLSLARTATVQMVEIR